MVFIYHIESVPEYRPIMAPFFDALARGAFRAVTSVTSLMEIAVHPLRSQRPEVADDYEILLLNYPNLRVLDVERGIARQHAELRAIEGLRPADSLQLATAMESGAGAFVTNDRAISRVSDIRVLVFDEFRTAQGQP